MARARLADVDGSVIAQDEALALEPTKEVFEWAALLSERTGRSERANGLRATAAGIAVGEAPLPGVEGQGTPY